MSEKSIFRRVRRPLAAARLSCADEADRFGIAMSPGVRDHEHPPLRRSAVEGIAIPPMSAAGLGVGLGLPPVPLEHLFSIYGILGTRSATEQEDGGRAQETLPAC